jgi:hypothetical protein
MKRKYGFLFVGIIALMLILIVTGYRIWNCLDPVYTCAKCHEIAPSHSTWRTSAHINVQCIECHGTAVSSLKEKSAMVLTHFTGGKNPEDIRLTEKQVLDITERCIQCHQAEHAGWLASGHAINYREIFMNPDHNAMEKPSWDCLRCHGMFYDGTIHDLMNLEGEPSSWVIKNKEQEERPVMPCLTCHQMHTDNPVSKRYVSSSDSSSRLIRNPRTALYVRADQMHLRSDMLTPVAMKDNGRQVNRAIDNITLLCQQCHAPDYIHTIGSQDDRTPVGVHEGFSCIACHKVHSGDTRESCLQCHAEVSPNCKLDVRTMNTTYLSRESPVDIHRISCVSCHEDRK